MEAARGNLHWRITIPDSGLSACDGLAPLLIDWGIGPHPAEQMPDHGLRLDMLSMTHPAPSRLSLGDPRIRTNTGPARLPACMPA